jgi:AcrR family transcriptional regulator
MEGAVPRRACRIGRRKEAWLALQRRDWIEAAFARLGASSVDAVRVEALARDLATTKGSFYWHFKDRSDLLAAVLEEWEAETDSIAITVQQESTPSGRLERFLALVTSPARDPGRAATETAVFAWAQRDAKVARRVAAVEAKRIDNAARLLREAGFPKGEAMWWAETGYTLFVGMMNRSVRDSTFARRSHADTLARVVAAAQCVIARGPAVPRRR